MGSARFIGRVGGLAVALGIGVGLASTPGIASAKPPTDSGSTTTTSTSGTAATTPTQKPTKGNAAGGNVSVSVNGHQRQDRGTADAYTTLGLTVISDPPPQLSSDVALIRGQNKMKHTGRPVELDVRRVRNFVHY
jgi:hypothetical protein